MSTWSAIGEIFFTEGPFVKDLADMAAAISSKRREGGKADNNSKVRNMNSDEAI